MSACAAATSPVLSRTGTLLVTVALSTPPIMRVSNDRMPFGVSSVRPPKGRRAMRNPSASTGAKLPRRPATSSRRIVVPTDAEFVLAAPTTDSHAASGCTTANDAMVGEMRGLGESASLVIHVATGDVTDTSHDAEPVLNAMAAMPVAMSRRWRPRTVRVSTSLWPGAGSGSVPSLRSMLSVCVVTRVARSTEKPNDSSTPDTLVIRPASARPRLPMSTRLETVVSAPVPS